MKLGAALIVLLVCYNIYTDYRSEAKHERRSADIDQMYSDMAAKHNQLVDQMVKTSGQLLQISDMMLKHNHVASEVQDVPQQAQHSCLLRAFDKPKTRRDR